MIRLNDLWCGYQGRAVLKGVSFCVRQGEFIGVLGPNGSGKTTLLLAISGIVPVEQGTVEIGGERSDRLTPKKRARSVAAVAQDTEMRFPFSCREVVRMGRYPHQKRWQMDSLQDAGMVERAMEITDIQGLADRLITAISGGERQRVIMARALAQEAPILLLDEAVSAMDIHRKLEIFRVLAHLNREEGLTILAVLHDVNLAALFCRRLLFLKDGRIVSDGPTESTLTAEILEEVYQAKALVQEISGTGRRQVVFLP